MKRASLFPIIIIVILVSTACGSSSSKSKSSSTSSANGTTSMTPALELAVGTLRLEGTSQSVDKKMAAQLLPYWQLIEELNASDSTAPQEITAVVENIQEIMTTEQVKAIQNMQLTQSDQATVIQDTGSAASSSTTTKITNIAQVSMGGGPGGAPPDGGGMPMDGGGPGGGVINSGSSQSTANSQNSNSADATSLIEQVIKILENRINS